jgi:RHS repeat-associated protein
MRSIDWIFSWCAMALLMAATSLTLNASIPRASYLSAQISKVADEENSSSLPVVEQDVSTEALCATAPLRETIRQSGNEEIRQFSNYLTDQVGTVLRIVKEDGTVVNQYDYDAFGRVRQASQNTFATVENRYLFQGREWDKHGGFYYFRNRIYLPERGEFATPDMNLGRGILGELDGMATLTFCGGDPVNCIDPTGLAFEIDIPGFFNPVMMNDFRKEPLPSEFVEQQAYMNRAVMGACTVAVAGPVVSLAAAEIAPAAVGAYPAAVGAYNGACGMSWTLYVEPWAAPAYAAAQAWIAKSLLRTAVVTYFGVTVTGKKGNVQPPVRPWYSTSANPQSGKVINPLAPTTGPRVNLQQSTEGAGGTAIQRTVLRVNKPRIFSDLSQSPEDMAFLRNEFQIKKNAIQRAAQRGELKWSPGTEDVRISSLQNDYRAAVAARYQRMFGVEPDMSALNADHPVDLLIGGGATQNLKMLSEAINKSVGSSLLQAGRRAGLTAGDVINEVIFVGP